MNRHSHDQEIGAALEREVADLHDTPFTLADVQGRAREAAEHVADTAKSDAQKKDVVAALKQNPTNAGKEFTVDYEVDETIKGGLQMYTETEFMDMSLQSRLDKMKAEVTKFVD